jgi:hypothetical protein
MAENVQKMEIERQKAQVNLASHQMKASDMAQRANERQMAARAKQQTGLIP